MKLLAIGCLLATSVGCHITDYPIVTDDRGDYSGVIRTGHKAYIEPTADLAIIYPDGSDDIFSMVYQNQYGDQRIYSFNNFDPTASVIYLDQSYCDWRYDGCDVMRSWNPHQDSLDYSWDYELNLGCRGALSVETLIIRPTRVGECGDSFRGPNLQRLASEFATLATTTWRGDTAYLVRLNPETMSMTFNGDVMPLYGEQLLLLDQRLRAALPMTPTARHAMAWVQQWAEIHGQRAHVELTYGSYQTGFEVKLLPQNIAANLTRF